MTTLPMTDKMLGMRVKQRIKQNDKNKTFKTFIISSYQQCILHQSSPLLKFKGCYLGTILKVEIFPSQFGKQQMSKEKEKGPEITNRGEEYDEKALRKYQVKL